MPSPKDLIHNSDKLLDNKKALCLQGFICDIDIYALWIGSPSQSKPASMRDSEMVG